MLINKTPSVICACAQVTDDQIKKLISERKCSLNDLQVSLGCGIECGSCIPDLQEMLGVKAWYPAHAFCQVVESTRTLDDPYKFYEIQLFPDELSNYPSPTIGQNVIIRLRDNDDLIIERTYTIVDFDPILRSITIIAKYRTEGKLTPIFAKNAASATPLKLEITEPVGGSLVLKNQHAIVFYVAGSGITPALAYIKNHNGTHPIYLDYSASTQEEFLFQAFFSSKKEQSAVFDYTLRNTSVSGRLNTNDISRVAEKHPNVQYLICGPIAFTQMVSNTLKSIGIDKTNIHTEAFSIDHTPQKKSSSIKKFAYILAFFLCLIPLILLSDKTDAYRPHGQANIGHEKLNCNDCHHASPGNLRQQLQAKVAYILGNRQTNPYFGNKPVSTKTCIACHANPDDHHPAQRFLEPKYEKARNALGIHQCISCHREHSNRRITLANVNYCMHCHAKTTVENDPIAPRHKTLIKNRQWETCLQCHDFHGNHKFKTPVKLEDAHKVNEIKAYFDKAKDPYGPVTFKAKQQEKDKK